VYAGEAAAAWFAEVFGQMQNGSKGTMETVGAGGVPPREPHRAMALRWRRVGVRAAMGLNEMWAEISRKPPGCPAAQRRVNLGFCRVRVRVVHPKRSGRCKGRRLVVRVRWR